MSYLKKISKLPAFIIPLALSIYLLSLPWHAPVVVKTTKPIDLTLELVKPDGSEFSESFSITPENPLELRSVSIKKWTTTDPDALNFESQGTLLPKNPEIKPQSLQTSFNVLSSIIFCTGSLAVILFFFMDFLGRNLTTFKYFSAAFFIHLIILGAVLFTNLPGLFSQDIFYNYWDAAGFSFSYFVGYIFSAFLIVGYQLFPSELLISFANVFVISSTLAALFVFCKTNRLLKWYLAISVLFYVYPVNIPLSLMGNRDLLAHWISLALCLAMFYIFSRKLHSLKIKLLLAFLLLICCFLRQENQYIFLPGLVILSWIHFRDLLKFSIFMAVMIFILSAALNFRNQYDKANYESTLIVNPLSSVLFNLYGKNLPPEVDARLGKFYKNHYLVEFHNEDDIDSFHRGGVNHPVVLEDYKQFRQEGLKIILSNPILFLKNRFHILKKSLGLSTHTQIIFSHHYYDDISFLKETKRRLHFKDHAQHGEMANKILHVTAEKPALLVASYLIPILIILTMCVISGVRSLYFSFAVLILARTCLVFLTAPASYFKYHYILWLFALFSLPFALYEKRASLTKSPHELKTQ